mmetsp:Transcript_84906/g.259243  ORF Transcript_84906/g.259243 Transcript_84906/m.259243 type:complete len:270 (-) Transcript_84906:232-1041(-)
MKHFSAGSEASSCIMGATFELPKGILPENKLLRVVLMSALPDDSWRTRTRLPPVIWRMAATRYVALLSRSAVWISMIFSTTSSGRSMPCSWRIDKSNWASASLSTAWRIDKSNWASASLSTALAVSLGCPMAGEAPAVRCPLSAMNAIATRSGKNRNVTTPSQISTTFGELTSSTTRSQMYAKIEKTAVTTYTGSSLILRTSPSGIATTHTAMIENRLKAALPTMVEGPRSPLNILFEMHVSTTFRRSSGALDPRAMSVKLATVGFHTT